MKTRENYEEQFKTTLVPSGEEGHLMIQMEILLDIRDLLIEIREEQLLAKITKEREEAQRNRESLVVSQDS
jgi:hypothetical protein